MYETVAGDIWDRIALFVYGDERYAGFLMKNNPALLGTVIFEAGTLVYVPDLPDEQRIRQEDRDGDIPDWRD